MGKKHFTEEQIAYALRQQEAGTPVAELTRKLGISEQTLLPVEEEVCRTGSGGAASPQTTRGGESETQATRG